MELDREDFRLWLAAKEPDEVVGDALLSVGCPLACYLRSRRGERAWGVGQSHAVVPGEPRTAIVLPAWARSFIRAVDALRVTGATAKVALTILDGIDVESW